MKSNNKRHKISHGVYLIIPGEYKRLPLPWKRKWLRALKLGGFIQGQKWLEDQGRYCCLGVLSVVQGRLTNESAKDNAKELHISNPCFSELGSEGKLPEGCIIMAHGETFSSLAEANDSGYLDFGDIAKVINILWKESSGPQ
jgi:hypothetical protein